MTELTGVLIVTHILSFCIGVLVCGAYSSRQVREVKADPADRPDITPQDRARRVM